MKSIYSFASVAVILGAVFSFSVNSFARPNSRLPKKKVQRDKPESHSSSIDRQIFGKCLNKLVKKFSQSENVDAIANGNKIVISDRESGNIRIISPRGTAELLRSQSYSCNFRTGRSKDTSEFVDELFNGITTSLTNAHDKYTKQLDLAVVALDEGKKTVQEVMDLMDEVTNVQNEINGVRDMIGSCSVVLDTKDEFYSTFKPGFISLMNEMAKANGQIGFRVGAIKRMLAERAPGLAAEIAPKCDEAMASLLVYQRKVVELEQENNQLKEVLSQLIPGNDGRQPLPGTAPSETAI